MFVLNAADVMLSKRKRPGEVEGHGCHRGLLNTRQTPIAAYLVGVWWGLSELRGSSQRTQEQGVPEDTGKVSLELGRDICPLRPQRRKRG